MAAPSENTRIEAFSDGVFAIAITLLVLDIRVPHVEESGQLKQALLAAWPAYAAYVVSFATIGIMWLNHHMLFKLIRRPDHIFQLLNLLRRRLCERAAQSGDHAAARDLLRRDRPL